MDASRDTESVMEVLPVLGVVEPSRRRRHRDNDDEKVVTRMEAEILFELSRHTVTTTSGIVVCASGETFFRHTKTLLVRIGSDRTYPMSIMSPS